MHEILVQDPTGTSLIRSRPLLPLQLVCTPQNKRRSPSPSNLRHYLSFCLTLSNTIRSRKMQQRSIWSRSTHPPPTHISALDCIYNWGSSPLPMLSRKNHHSFVPQSPESFPIRKGNVLETLPLQFLQPSKLFNSIIKNSIPSFQQHKGNFIVLL